MPSKADKIAAHMQLVSDQVGAKDARREIVEALGNAGGTCLGVCVGSLIDSYGAPHAILLLSELCGAIAETMRPEAPPA